MGKLMGHTDAGTQPVAEHSSAVPITAKSDRYSAIAPLWHTVLVLVTQGVLSYRGRTRLGELHTVVGGGRIPIYERTMLFEWLMLGLVLAGVWWHGSSLLTVLGQRWSSVGRFLRDLGIGVMFLIVAMMMGSLLPHGDDHVARLILPQAAPRCGSGWRCR
jgi:hypothetical protein